MSASIQGRVDMSTRIIFLHEGGNVYGTLVKYCWFFSCSWNYRFDYDKEVIYDGGMANTLVAIIPEALTKIDTCKEQMLYEIHNPKAYLTPDCIADFSNVRFTQVGENKVMAWGATSHGITETLKVNVCYRDSFITDCEISYGGCNALDRARLAGDMFVKRLDRIGVKYNGVRVDYIGYIHTVDECSSTLLSSWGFEFLKLNYELDKSPDDPDTLKKVIFDNENEGLLHYKYIPCSEAGFNKADVKCITMTPSKFMVSDEVEPLPPQERIWCTGNLEWKIPRWEDMPTQYHIVQGLASMPVVRIIGSSKVHLYHYNDVYHQKIIEYLE